MRLFARSGVEESEEDPPPPVKPRPPPSMDPAPTYPAPPVIPQPLQSPPPHLTPPWEKLYPILPFLPYPALPFLPPPHTYPTHHLYINPLHAGVPVECCTHTLRMRRSSNTCSFRVIRCSLVISYPGLSPHHPPLFAAQNLLPPCLPLPSPVPPLPSPLHLCPLSPTFILPLAPHHALHHPFPPLPALISSPGT